MCSVKIWHNPSCSKSRAAMEILDTSNCETQILKYLENTPNVSEIKNTLSMLGVQARELMRTKEDIYIELNLKDEMNEDKLIEAMVQNPKLIERPILFKNGKAIIGRPTSIIADFINS